jgi:hypothetical protein
MRRPELHGVTTLRESKPDEPGGADGSHLQAASADGDKWASDPSLRRSPRSGA